MELMFSRAPIATGGFAEPGKRWDGRSHIIFAKEKKRRREDRPRQRGWTRYGWMMPGCMASRQNFLPGPCCILTLPGSVLLLALESRHGPAPIQFTGGSMSLCQLVWLNMQLFNCRLAGSGPLNYYYDGCYTPTVLLVLITWVEYYSLRNLL
jgi:hypothetical protein